MVNVKIKSGSTLEVENALYNFVKEELVKNTDWDVVSLDRLDYSGNLNRIFWYFEIKLLSILGLRPHLANCPQCNEKLYTAFFSVGYGELVCGKCISGSARVLSAGTLKVIKNLSESNLNSLHSIQCNSVERKEFGHFIKEYLRYHVEGLQDVRSLRVMESILR